jgi:hypothetical protein
VTTLIRPSQNEFVSAYEKMTGLRLEDNFVAFFWSYMGRIRNSVLNNGKVRIRWTDDQIILEPK